jgi:DNA polymerase-4
MSGRTILHADLDAFYASVEQRDDPSLRGRPVIVGGQSGRGVVCAASYEARKFGVHSAQSMVEARQRCPKAIVITPRFEVYSAVSGEFFSILHDFTPLVEGLSLDEAFLDVSASAALFGDGPTIAAAIRDRVRRELRITCSVGIASVKFIAKIASDLRKPDGQVVVEAGRERDFLAPLPVGRLWGVGKVTEKELAQAGLTTIGELARYPVDSLARRVGRDSAAHLHALAHARDERHVEPERAPVSIGHEDTFEKDHHTRAPLEVHLLDQADRTCARLRDGGYKARVVTLKLKYADHSRTSRRLTLPRPTADGRVVGRVLVELLAEVPDVEARGVRLTGVSCSGLEGKDAPRQLFFDESEDKRGEALGATIDRIAARFGDGALRRAVHVSEAPQVLAVREPRKP